MHLTIMKKRITPIENQRLEIILNNIEYLKQKRDLPESDMLRQTGISRQSMHQYRKRSFFPLLYQLESMARYFNTHFVELLLSLEEVREMISKLVTTRQIDIRGTGTKKVWDPQFLLTIPAHIRDRRKKLRLTLREVETLMEKQISFGSLSKYESGKSIHPRIIVPLSEVLEITPLELMTPREHVIPIVRTLARKYGVS
jgi:transcriptional regulator with XRE-family HTH domain